MSVVKVFISYSHIDDPLREQLVNHLQFLEDEGVSPAWCDKNILAGKEWETEINAKLNDANIILLLVSSNHKGSSYCRFETERARERYEAGEAEVIPIILRECFWRIAWYSKLNPLPKDGIAIIDWPSLDKAFTHITEEIYKVVKDSMPTYIDGSQSPISTLDAQSETAPPIAEDQARNAASNILENDSSNLFTSNDNEQGETVIENLYNKLLLLSEQEQARYFELAVFPSDIAIPLVTLRKLWAGDLSEYAADALCERLRELSLLTYDNAGGFVRLHEQIRLHLIKHDKGVNQDYYQPRLPSIHHQLLNAYKPSPVRKWSAMPDNEPYFWDQLIFHLKEAERTEELLDTLDDWQYLVKKMRLRGVDSIESDLLTAEETGSTDYRLRTIKLIFANFRDLFDSWMMAGGSKAAQYAEVQYLEDVNLMLQDQAQNENGCYLTLKFKLPKLDPIGVRGCHFSIDGKQIVSASDDGTIKVWDADLGEMLHLYDRRFALWNEHLSGTRVPINGHTQKVRCCDFGPAGALIVSASYDSKLIIWDADSRESLYILEGHSDAVNGCCFSTNGKLIVSASSDHTIKLWDVKSGQCLTTFYADGEMFCCAMYEDMIVAGGARGLYFLKLVR